VCANQPSFFNPIRAQENEGRPYAGGRKVFLQLLTVVLRDVDIDKIDGFAVLILKLMDGWA